MTLTDSSRAKISPRAATCRLYAFLLCLSCLLAPFSTFAQTPTVLRIWVSEVHEDRLHAIEYLKNVFEALNEDILIETTAVEENDFIPKLKQSLANSTAPCLVGTASDLIVAMGEQGFLDIQEAGNVLQSIGLQRFYKGALSILETPEDGAYYGIPFHGWIQGLWYRADWFEKEGLAPPTNWPAILKAARTFTQPDQGIYGILIGTKVDHYATQVFTHLATSNGARMFDSSGTVMFDNPRMVETLAFYKELAAYTPPGPQTWRARDFYLQGRLAMMFYSTFIMDDLALQGVAADSLTNRNFPELPGAAFDPELVRNTRMVPILVKHKGAAYGMVNALGLVKPALSAHVSDGEVDLACARFLQFLYTPSVYITWLHMAPGGMMPVFRDIAEDDAFMRDLTGVFRRYGRPKVREIIQGLERISNFSHAGDTRQTKASVVYARNIISAMIQKTLSGEMTPKQAVHWADRQIRDLTQQLDAHAALP